MAAKGYTNATLVAKELARDLTAPQLDECADMVEQAESFIDLQTGRAWMVDSPTTAELHQLQSSIVYLRNKPVTAITSVTARNMLVGAASSTLVAGTDYELLDGPNGVMLVSAFAGAAALVFPSDPILPGALLSVSYSSTTPAPADIQRAATLLVAHWMSPRLDADRQGVQSYSVGSSGDTFNVTFAKLDVPDEVMRMLTAREAVLFG